MKAKKQKTPEGRRRAGDAGKNLGKVMPTFAVFTGVKLPENADKKTQVKAVQKNLKRQGIQLDPYKFDVEKEEELMVQPNPIVGEDGRRRQLRESIFDDTWASVKIPASVRRHWKKENREIIKARDKEREAKGWYN